MNWKDKRLWIFIIIIVALIILLLPIWHCSCARFPPGMVNRTGKEGACRCFNFFEVLIKGKIVY